ncbi:glycosyl hydrolase family 28-related protein [Methylobacterium oxalidis]|nr:glycosyl hydrolase family 28-related protein [Methylobacterium oxalidis]
MFSVADYPSIQAAIDAAEASSIGGAVYIPAGVYNIEETLRVSKSGIGIFGDGPESTVLLSHDPMRDAIHVASQDGRHLHGFSLRDVCFKSANHPRTGGAYVHLDTVQTVAMERIVMNEPFIGFHLSNTTILDLSKFDIRSPQVDGVGILIDGDADSNDHWIHHGIIRGNPSLKSRAGVEIRNSGFSTIDSIDAYQCGTGLLLRSDSFEAPRMPGRAQVEHIWTRSCSWDTCLEDGLRIEAVGEGRVRRVRSLGDWYASNFGCGVRIKGSDFIGPDGASILGVDFIDAHSFVNHEDGFHIDHADYWTIQTCKVAGNGHPSPGQHDGVRVVSRADHFKIIDNIIGDTELFPRFCQDYGIRVEAGSTDRYRITGNDLSCNRTGGLLDEGTGRKIVRGNIDWNDGATWTEEPAPVEPAVSAAPMRQAKGRFGWPRRA